MTEQTPSNMNTGDQAGNAPKRYEIVINRRSGYFLENDPDELSKRLCEVLSASGAGANAHIVTGAEIGDTVERCLEGGAPDGLILCGGDGTVQGVLARAVEAKVPLGLLPMGTLNFLARDLNIPLDVDRAIEAMPGFVPTEVDVASVNGEYFACVATLGFGARLARYREKERGKSFFSAAANFFRSFDRLVPGNQRMKLKLKVNGREDPVKTYFMAFSNNPFADVPGLIPRRKSLVSGTLGLYVSQHTSPWSVMHSSLAYLRGSWEDDPELMFVEADEVQVSARRDKRVLVMVDGEVKSLQLPLKVTLHPRALRILAPEREAEPPTGNGAAA